MGVAKLLREIPLASCFKMATGYTSEEEGVLVLPGHYWRVGKRYKDLEYLALGGNGLVCKAVDTQTGKRVVISKRDSLFSKTYCQRDLRELQVIWRLQKALGDDVPIPELIDIVCEPANQPIGEGTKFYVVQEAKEGTIEIILQGEQLPSQEQVKLLMYQLLRALKLFHSAGIIHRCIRTNDILVDADCDLCVCDFRLAAVNGIESDPNFELLRFTDSYRVEHLHYWAPEVLINEEITPVVDIWSAGCIFAELLTGVKVFGCSDVRGQLDLIVDLLGAPSLEDLAFVKGDASRTALTAVQNSPSTFEERFKNIDPVARDLLKKMLVFNPGQRITADKALEHPYLSQYHDPKEEPVYSAEKPLWEELLVSDQSLDVLRSKLIQEVQEIKAWLMGPEVEAPIVNGHPWHVGSRYRNLEFLTKGTNGAMCVATDTRTGNRVVISKRDGLYSQEYCKRNLREIQILNRLQQMYADDYDPFPRIVDFVCHPQNLSGPKQSELYVVQTAFDTNLAEILHHQRMTPDQIWCIMYSLLVSLKLLHSAGVVHRCIRPRHLLLNSELDLAVCDLRRSIICGQFEGCGEEYNWTGSSTEGSWQYLSPEAVCYDEQTTACDIWSAGCVFGEMLLGHPLFVSDANAVNIFRVIFATLGRPKDQELAFVKSKIGFQALKELKINDLPSLDDMLKKRNVDLQAVDLLKKMLAFSPGRRITAEEALKHPYLAKLHDPAEEPVYTGKKMTEEIVTDPLPTAQLRAKILEEVHRFSLPQ